MSEHDLASEFNEFEGELPDTVDEAAVRRMRFVARLLDDAIPVPGTNYRIGLDPLMGAAPIAGDVVTGLISLYIVAESARLGVSYQTLVKMLLNVSIDVGGGSIPVVGTLFDAAWKSNKRNMELLVDELKGKAPGSEDPLEIDVE
jgi:hypothetical protein